MSANNNRLIKTCRTPECIPYSYFTGVLVCLIAAFIGGCRRQEQQPKSEPLNKTSAADELGDKVTDAPVSVSDSQSKLETGKSYLPIFEKDLPQNVISHRMEQNFARFHQQVDPADLVHFPSAGLLVYPPQGFVKSTRFNGFEDLESGSNVMILTNPFSMELQTKTIINQAVHAENSGVLYQKTTTNDGKVAIFYANRESYSAETEIVKFTLAFGDDAFSWVITASFQPKHEDQCGEEFLKCVLNARISEQPRLPPGEDVDFTIVPNRLQLTDGFVDKLVFARDGVFPVDSTQEPIFQAAKLPLKWFSLGRETVAKLLMRPSPLFEVQAISSQKSVTIDELEGFEFLGVGRDLTNDEPLQIYSVTLFSDDYTYTMNGWASANNPESYIADFRSLANSLKRKEK